MDDQRKADVRRLMTPKQLADVLDVEVNTLANWRVLGRGPAFIRMGTTIRYDERDVQLFINQSRRRSTADPGHVPAPSAA